MKKVLLVIAIIAGFGGTASAQSKVAHVNTQKLLDTMPSRMVVAQSIEDYRLMLEKELKEMQEDYYKSLETYQTTKGDMTQQMKAYREKSLGEKEQRIMAREQSAQNELVTISNELQEPLFQRVKDAIRLVSEKMKLAYVLDETNTLYFGGGTDITADVITELLKLEKEAIVTSPASVNPE
ncbi:OmpH family outer membrane protein [Crocinitomicaceae bacterium]|nr:OmpH family outer membrane protein [Crocinitomicaceae bacterium]